VDWQACTRGLCQILPEVKWRSRNILDSSNTFVTLFFPLISGELGPNFPKKVPFAPSRAFFFSLQVVKNRNAICQIQNTVRNNLPTSTNPVIIVISSDETHQ
jgi:hypothetical protein